MKHFWQGFSKHSAPVQFKKHVIVLYWAPSKKAEPVKEDVKQLSNKYPSVKVKSINIEKDPIKPSKHSVSNIPTVLLLKNGREVDRVTEGNKTLLEQLFRKAHV